MSSLIKSASLLLVCFVILTIPLFASEESLYQDIKRLDKTVREKVILDADSSENTKLRELCGRFLKSYAKSKKQNEIKMIAAAAESSPVSSVKLYDSIIKNASSSAEKNEAAFKACELLYLSSRFEQCAQYAKGALAVEKNPDKKRVFALLRIRSLIIMQEYDSALSLIKVYTPLLADESDALVTEIVLRTGEGIEPAKSKPASSPTLLYFLARKFELDHRTDFAYSAYKDLHDKYPRSPEAMGTTTAYLALQKQGAVYKKDYLASSKNIALSHDYSVEPDSDSKIYAVLIGPIYDLNESKRIKKEMTSDFSEILLVRGTDGFYLYVGRESTAEKALALKIRLAEEYALNGKIALIKENNGREYIYGE
jgi:hypothetical protein